MTFLRVVIVALLVLVGPSAYAQTDGFKVIVHGSNAEATMEAAHVSRMFLKKIRRWPDGTQVTPFDLDERSPVREAFSRAIHQKSVSAIMSYWQRMIFSGRDVPPQIMSGDADMMRAVSGTPGGIGYVSDQTPLRDGVKELEITE